MNRISKILAICYTVVLVSGCDQPTPREIYKKVDATGRITDEQAEFLSSNWQYIFLDGLTSITDKQAEILSKAEHLILNGLSSITDPQAEHLSKVKDLYLRGLTSISDRQAECLIKGRMHDFLFLDGLTFFAGVGRAHTEPCGPILEPLWPSWTPIIPAYILA